MSLSEPLNQTEAEERARRICGASVTVNEFPHFLGWFQRKRKAKPGDIAWWVEPLKDDPEHHWMDRYGHASCHDACQDAEKTTYGVQYQVERELEAQSAETDRTRRAARRRTLANITLGVGIGLLGYGLS